MVCWRVRTFERHASPPHVAVIIARDKHEQSRVTSRTADFPGVDGHIKSALGVEQLTDEIFAFVTFESIVYLNIGLARPYMERLSSG